MAFCKYCGKPLNNGEKCNCSESKKNDMAFAMEQERLRKQYYIQQQQKAQQNKGRGQQQGWNQNQINGGGQQPGWNPNQINGGGQQPGWNPNQINGGGQQPGWNPNQYSGWENLNNSKAAASVGKNLLSTIVDTFRSPIDAVKNLGKSKSIAESFIIIGICMVIIFFEMLIASVILELLSKNIFGDIDINIVGPVVKYTLLILIGLFLWGLLVAGLMLATSKYIFHEKINFIQTYAVVTIKTFAATVLFTAYIIFTIAMAFFASLFREEIVAQIVKFVMFVFLAVIMFPNLISTYGYYEILSKKPSVRIYEILVMNLVLLVVSYLIGIVAVHILQEYLQEMGSSLLMSLLGF